MTTTTATQSPYPNASVYVGDLDPAVTEALLFEVFSTVGPVASVRVCRDTATRRSLGYAYVNFHRLEDAERALDTMNFTSIRGRPCRIMWSHRDPSLRKSGVGNIFVKYLAPTIDNKALYDTFSMFGNILSCKVATNHKGESLGYGFVHYENEEAARNAINNVNGMVIAGQTVQVSPFKSKKERGANKTRFTNVYVKNIPSSFTLEKFQELFGQFGKVTSSMLAFDEERKRYKGFGFVNFEKPESAAKAVDELNEKEFEEGKKLYVCRAQKKEEREKELRERFEQLKQERHKKYAGVNLYVKNLSDEITDDRLREEFSKFGLITSARVMREGEKSKGFGFVCFNSPEEATRAVTEMTGKMLDGKPLYVALAQRREVRRAQLEAQHAARAKMGLPQPMYAPQGPMFYPHQGLAQQRLIYPQMMPRRGWTQPQGRPSGPQMMAYPINQMGIPPMNVRPPPRGGRGQRNQQQPQQFGKMKNGTSPNQSGRGRGNNFKYTGQVRNQHQQMVVPQQPSSPPQSDSSVQVPNLQGQQKPLTIEALARAPEEQQKQMIGERLFPLVHHYQPQLAGKITGMLLEMDNGELLHLLESNDALFDKVEEALTVLQQHQQEAQETTPEESTAPEAIPAQ